MIHYFKRLIITVTFLFSSIEYLNAYTTETFYQDPTYKNFLKFIHEEIPCFEFSDLDLAANFLLHIYSKHPKYFENLDFDQFPLHSQLALGAVILSIDKDNPIVKLNNNSLVLQMNSINIIPLKDWEKFEINNLKDLGLVWGCFFATGDKKFLIKILQAINKNDYALLYACELTNRESILRNKESIKNYFQTDAPNDLEDISDLILFKARESLLNLMNQVDELEKTYPHFSEVVLIAKDGIWSLESLCNEDFILAQMIDEILSEEPNLNFRIKIQNMF